MKPVKRSANGKKEKSKRGCLIAVVVVLALILALLIAGTVMISSIFNRIERVDDTAETLSEDEIASIMQETEPDDIEVTGEVLADEEVTLPTEAVELVETSDDIINILLVGQDSSSGRSRSDAMILCTINKSDKSLTMTSFLRDLYVRVPGYGNQRLNVAYAVGGFSKLYETLEYNFGVQVDYGVCVNFSSFPKVIDALGGVEINLTDAEVRHMNTGMRWDLSTGVNLLNGEEALVYSRIRAIGSDFGRTSRQQNVLKALLSKAKNMSLSTLLNLVDTIVPMVKTDMEDSEIISVVMDVAPMLSGMKIISQKVPIDGEYKNATIKGMAVLVADMEATREFLVETIGAKN